MTENKLRQEILDAITSGCSNQEITEMLDIPYQNLMYYIKALKAEGVIMSEAKGKYVIVTHPNGGASEPVKPAVKSVNRMAESVSRRVSLPEYMRTRSAVTLFVEHSPTEVENVMRLELQIGGIWIPIPVNSDLRICVGEDIPRWSASQEIYNGVSNMRMTFRNGEQNEYAHNPQVPLTVDAKS